MSNDLMTGLFNEMMEDQKQQELNAELADKIAAETSACFDYTAGGETDLMNSIIVSYQANDALATLIKAEAEINSVDFNNFIDAEAFESTLHLNTFGIYAKEESDDDKGDKKPGLKDKIGGKLSKIREGIKRAIEVVKKVIFNLQRRFTLWLKNSRELSDKRIKATEAQIKRAKERNWPMINLNTRPNVYLGGAMSILVDRKAKTVLLPKDIIPLGHAVAEIEFDVMAKGFIDAMKTSLIAEKTFPQVTRLTISKGFRGATYKEEGKEAIIAAAKDIGPRIEVKGLNERSGKMSFKVVAPAGGTGLATFPMDERQTLESLDLAVVLFMKSKELDKNDITEEAEAFLKTVEKDEADIEKIQGISTEVTNYVAFTFAINTYMTKIGLAVLDYGTKSINATTYK